MKWQDLTSPDFARAVQSTGVCVFSMGVLEKHSEHLPLGTDYLLSQRVSELAAEKEQAVVFPPFYFGQIYEARCFPGTVTIKPTLLYKVIQATLDEIGRNGFKKIVIHNGHGGNWNLIKFLAQASLWEQKPYTIYVQSEWITPDRRDQWNALLETKLHGHACECESSMMLAAFPELVRMDQVPAEPTSNLGRMSHLTGSFSGIGWYAGYPDHYAGDARTASAEKGRKLLELSVDSLADFIRQVKDDKAAPALESEFFGRVDAVGR